MAGRNPIGGKAPAAQEAPVAAPESTLPKLDTSSFWGSPASEPVMPTDSTKDLTIGQESPSLREARESMPADPMAEETKSASFVRKNVASNLKGFLKPGNKTSLKQQAILRHADLLDISSNLANTIEDFRRKIPAVKNGAVHPIYDMLHGALTEADHHLAQAGIEHERGHYGVDYLDKYPAMENKAVSGVGMAELRKTGGGSAELSAEVGAPKETELRNKILPKGSIGFTRRAADILQEVASHLTKISLDGRSAAATNSRLQAPEHFDPKGEVQNDIMSAATEYASKIDLAHKADNPDRPEKPGLAFSASAQEDIKRLNDPTILSNLGERGLAARKMADIKSLFDRRGQGRKSHAEALQQHADIQRQLADTAFEKIFGERLRQNQEAGRANRDVVSRARAAVETAKTRVVPTGPASRLDLSRASGALDATPSRPGGASSDENSELTRRATAALKEAEASGNTEVAEKLKGHLGAISHHNNLAKLNSGAGGPVVREGADPSTVLSLPSGAEAAKNLKDFGDVRRFDVSLDNTRSVPQSLENSASAVAARPGDRTTTLETPQAAEVKHAYYEKPVIDRLTGTVREGKNDDRIAAIKKEMQSNIDPKTEKVIDQSLAARQRQELDGLYAEHRQVKEKYETPEGVLPQFKGTVSAGKLEAADRAYMDAVNSDTSSRQNIPALKSALVAHHSSEAASATEQLRQTLVGLGKVPNTPTTIARVAPDLMPTIEAASNVRIPNPEVPTREQFYAASGVNPDPSRPTLKLLTSGKGKPVGVKRGRSRGAVFADSLGRQYAYGDSFKVPQSEEEYKVAAESAKQAAKEQQDRNATGRATVGAGLAAEGAKIAAGRESERQARIATANRIGLPENLQPLLSSDMPAVRGILPLGTEGSKPLVSASKQSAIVPGIGVVPIPPRKTTKKGKTKRIKKLSAANILGLTSEDLQDRVSPLNLRNLKLEAPQTALEERDLAQQDEAKAKKEKLGRQFDNFTAQSITEALGN